MYLVQLVRPVVQQAVLRIVRGIERPPGIGSAKTIAIGIVTVARRDDAVVANLAEEAGEVVAVIDNARGAPDRLSDLAQPPE